MGCRAGCRRPSASYPDDFIYLRAGCDAVVVCHREPVQAAVVALGAAVVFGMAVNTIFATIYIPNWYEVMQHIQEKWLTKKK